MKRFILSISIVALALVTACPAHALAAIYSYDDGGTREADICIYGATSGGIMAAYTATKAASYSSNPRDASGDSRPADWDLPT